MTKIDAGGWLAAARQQLSRSSERPQSEAGALLAKVLQRPRYWLAAHPETPLSDQQVEQLDQLLQRLAGGEPLPYVLGRWEFFGMEFTVTPDVLIPRPETELLVETALKWLRGHPGRYRAADVGTGTGCIATSLAVNHTGLRLVAVDRSAAALRVARENFARYGLLERVRLCQSDLLSALRGPFDLVCANLPYIPSKKLDELAVSRYEPRAALDGGPQGLDLIAWLLADAPCWLAQGGLMLLEIEAGQGESVPRLARGVFPDANITLLPDLAGHARLVTIEV